jgi:hypothetical protein
MAMTSNDDFTKLCRLLKTLLLHVGYITTSDMVQMVIKLKPYHTEYTPGLLLWYSFHKCSFKGLGPDLRSISDRPQFCTDTYCFIQLIKPWSILTFERQDSPVSPALQQQSLHLQYDLPIIGSLSFCRPMDLLHICIGASYNWAIFTKMLLCDCRTHNCLTYLNSVITLTHNFMSQLWV